MPEEAKLYIGNIPFEATESQIRRKFDRFGPVEEVKIVFDRVTDKPKGYAFVTFENVEDSRDAMSSLDQGYFEGRKLKVEQSKRDGDRRYDSGRPRYGRRDDRYGRSNYDQGDRYRNSDRSSRDDRFRNDRGNNYGRRDSYRDGRSGGGHAGGSSGRRNDSRSYEPRSRSYDRF